MTQPTLPQSKTSFLHEFEGDGFYLAQFKTPQLAIFSYYLESQSQAYLIDPTYDVYPYQALAQKRKAKIISILLTHYHADYIAGHTQFNLPLIMGPKSLKQGSKIKTYEMNDNASFNLGSVWIKVLHTPGHTLQSTCFQLLDAKHKQICLFTGDTIFLGDVGRPDLAVSSSMTKQDLAKMLFESLNKIKKQVDHSVRIYPTHGSGSACGKSIGQGNFCTLEKQLQNNYALKIQNQAQFIQKILNEMPKPPSYFFHDAKLNQTGQATRFDDLLKNAQIPLKIEQFKSLMDKGCLVLDSRHEFGGKTIKGSWMMSQNGTLATWVGTLISPQTQLLLICTNKQKAKDLIQRLLRIGYFNIKGYNNFTMDEWKQKGLPIWQPKTINAKQLSQIKDKNILDVRNLGQWKTGILQGAILISLGQIITRGDQVKNVNNLHIHCKSGLRARLASSILAQKGIESTIIADKFQEFAAAGNKIVEYK